MAAVVALAAAAFVALGVLATDGGALLCWSSEALSDGGRSVLPCEVVINEVLYDPEGKDAGLEFVEVFNPGDTSIHLSGWRLESGNGAAPDRWAVEWVGTAGDTLGPRCFFVVGEEMVAPRPQAVTDLDLQNGPDACRLVSPRGTCDLVGWGDHAYSEYYEGRPAAESGSGHSLARDPDGVDTEDNAEDFASLAPPSPGGFNRPPCDLGVVRAGRSRYAPPTAAQIDISCVVRNEGSDACGDSADLVAAVAGLEFTTRLGESIAPGGDLRATVRVPNPGAGLHGVAVWISCQADPRRANDSLRTSLLVPPPPLVLNEVMTRPAGTECEWVEILNRSPAALSIKDWTIEDSGGKPRAVTDEDLTLGPGEFAVMVESEDAFFATYPGLAADSQVVALRPKGGWPALNDVDGPRGFADAVVVRDKYGTAVDSVAYGEGWAAPGASLERIDPAGWATEASNWSPHCGSGGSPGRRNSVSALVPDGTGLLSIAPQVFTPGGDGSGDLVAVSVRVAVPSTVRLAVFDVNGRLVRRLLDGGRVEATRVTFWDGSADDGSPAPMGVYIIMAEAGSAGGRGPVRAKAAIVLVRR